MNNIASWIWVLIPITAIVAGIFGGIAKRWIRLKEREMQLSSQMTAEKAAQYAARTERLEQRVQVLERGMAPRLYALLEAYGRLSGVPILLNTSFNLSGEPIVNRAVEGYLTFRRCGMDVLVAGQTRVTKKVAVQ